MSPRLPIRARNDDQEVRQGTQVKTGPRAGGFPRGGRAGGVGPAGVALIVSMNLQEACWCVALGFSSQRVHDVTGMFAMFHSKLLPNMQGSCFGEEAWGLLPRMFLKGLS